MKTLMKFAVTALLVLVPATARADWYVFPFAAGNTGGQTTQESGTYGASLGWNRGWWGVEAELACSPEFFDDDGEFRSSHEATTFTGTAIVGPSMGAWRPYGAFGIGVLSLEIEEVGELASVGDNNPALHAGGGLVWQPDSGIGFRGDVRYIRSLDDQEPDANVFPERFADFDYWRVGGGVVIRW
jgi:hypothetical protein